MKDKFVEMLRLSWKVQTFQYAYLSHVKGWFVLGHLFLLVVSLVLLCIHRCFGLFLILGIMSWNYFSFFDKSRIVYKDSYTPQAYERTGTLFTTVSFCIILSLGVLW
jgi:hypothetical protein